MVIESRRILAWTALVSVVSWGRAAPAQEPYSEQAASSQAPLPREPAADVRVEEKAPHDVRGEVPIVAFTYAAHGASARTVGAEAYGLLLAAKQQDFVAGGGATVWGSPIDRLTLVGDASRNTFGNFSPSGAVIVRIAGKKDQGFSLGALGKFKIDGFGVGPNKEVEAEIEGGILVSYGRNGWHMDANAIAGFGLGDDGEIDVEGRLRFGRDLTKLIRVGLDGQIRVRAAGTRDLLGGRTWDIVGGPQFMIGAGHFFGAVTAGPATLGVASGVGWQAVGSFAATTY